MLPCSNYLQVPDEQMTFQQFNTPPNLATVQQPSHVQTFDFACLYPAESLMLASLASQIAYCINVVHNNYNICFRLFTALG